MVFEFFKRAFQAVAEVCTKLFNTLSDILSNIGKTFSKKPVGCTSKPCPSKKEITDIKLISMTFTTDHNLLLDNKSDWTDSGSRYAKPEWKPGHSYPITHTKATPVGVKLELEVTPADASTTTGDLSGSGPDESLTFEGTVSVAGGKCTGVLNAKSALPDNVMTLLNKNISWKITVEGKVFNLGSTGPHSIYVTFGIPYGSNVTEKRVAQVVKMASGKTKEQECVNAIFDDMKRFHYDLGASYPSPVWLIYDGTTTGECNALADLFERSCKMLGLPDKFQLGYIYPLTQSAGGKFDISGSANEKRNVATTHSGQPAKTHGFQEDLVFRDFSTRTSPYQGWNNFEGTVKYEGVYYCIGEGRYNSPTETMRSMVVATAWVSSTAGYCKNPGPCPEKIWNSSRWYSIPRPC